MTRIICRGLRKIWNAHEKNYTKAGVAMNTPENEPTEAELQLTRDAIELLNWVNGNVQIKDYYAKLEEKKGGLAAQAAYFKDLQFVRRLLSAKS